MVMRKIYSIVRERRLPWLLRSRLNTLVSRYHFYRNRIHSRRQRRGAGGRVIFSFGYHEKTGAATANANLANLLSRAFHVDFLSKPTSSYNRLLDDSVHIVDAVPLDGEVFICNVSCDHGFLRRLREAGKTCIVTCHCLSGALHGFDCEQVQGALDLADMVHFVGPVQEESFQLGQGRYVVIPNATKPIRKSRKTNNVGIVGVLSEERKNARESLDIALESDAGKVHLWGSDESFRDGPRIEAHGWEANKEKIYNSFDVLLCLSKQEVTPMVIVEALSAGLPCLLSSISALDQFRACPGVVTVDARNREQAPRLLNELLRSKDELREPIMDFWAGNYSEAVILEKWRQLLAGFGFPKT